ncbi:MAG: PHP domain-containing protein [Chloroflexi bacterium]|nr:PHP domain-containing protein [Chloroflexota bacterium]
MFFLDMHVHSADLSDDSVATVEGYAKWILTRRKRGYRVDGIVLTEHRGFNLDADYSQLSQQYDVLILRGSEIETDVGHVLVYGVTPRLLQQFDFRNVNLPAHEVFRAIRDTGGAFVAAHPGRARTGIWEFAQDGADLSSITVAELLNGGSTPDENAKAAEVVQERGYVTTGGSDAHRVSDIARCLTAFQRPIRRIEDLVEELLRGEFHAVELTQTLDLVHEGRA